MCWCLFCLSVDQMAEKLDALMTVAFRYIAKHSDPAVSAEQRDHVFHLVLGVFEKCILHTFKYDCVVAVAYRETASCKSWRSLSIAPCV